MRRLFQWAGAPAAVMLACAALAACGDREGEAAAPGAPEPVNRTVAAVIDDADGLDALEGAIENAGLETVLEGTGPYTVFAPSDTALGEAARDLSGEALRAESAALIRAHIVPGALTRSDIGAAIDRKGGPVEMRTMADGVLTFARDGTALVVTAPGGARARLTGDETVASNGVVQPLDASLIAAPAA